MLANHRLKQRLLHAGAATSDIIGQYVATIKVLRIIDPTFVTIDRIAEPINAYLQYVYQRASERLSQQLATDTHTHTHMM
jgi:hypothetical protein